MVNKPFTKYFPDGVKLCCYQKSHKKGTHFEINGLWSSGFLNHLLIIFYSFKDEVGSHLQWYLTTEDNLTVENVLVLNIFKTIFSLYFSYNYFSIYHVLFITTWKVDSAEKKLITRTIFMKKTHQNFQDLIPNFLNPTGK